ncbi:MAG TPA: tripartite tricarboxylate transporter substrate binding protein [Burkholderiales bacterium]|jgi:tripartite-type tricarboxylate transporter receptor subunit TctC|nr:tripartite tricarboxylate transporter substrate binding protein [Burkholderiales bacterium]
MTRVALLLVTLAFAGSAFCQAYPNRAVKVVVPWPPGQATDLAARIVADKLSQSLAQPFVIENKPGAGGQIGTEQVVKAAPDGYTLLAASSGPISIMPNLQKVPYDTQKDLAPVSLIAAAPFALVTQPSFPANNAKEFIALVRANPDKYTFSSSGTGATAHLFSELFMSMAQIKARHVPYKGSAPALTDVINGQISYTIETVAATVGHIKSGRLKTFGVTTAKRTAALPDVPPLAEAGDLPGYDTAAWIGYEAPAGTPREILMRLAAEIQKALQASDLRERYVALGLDPVWNTPDEMVAYKKREADRYGQIIRNANIKIEQ